MTADDSYAHLDITRSGPVATVTLDRPDALNALNRDLMRELTDAATLRARQIAEMDLKQQVYGERYPLDEDFIAAVAAMPEACGVALGFDRLVMLAAHAPQISDVIWTPLPVETQP